MDYRLLWFVKCVNNVFEIGAERDAAVLFGETLNKDDGSLKRQFARYLESSAIDRDVDTNVFYVYTTTVKKIVKEEIEVEEELSELEIQSLRESDCKKKKKRHHQDKKKKRKHAHAEDHQSSVGDSPATDSDKETDDGKSRDGYSSPDTAIQMADEDGINKRSEKLYKKVKVIQEKIITLPELHVRFGSTGGCGLDANVGRLYFVKTTNTAVPAYDLAEEADYYMPGHFLVGNQTGCLVNAMASELDRVWIPAVQRLFVDPFSHDCVTARARRTLASASAPSTFVRVAREIKAQHDYEILIGERPDGYERRRNTVDLEKIIALNELFTLEPLPFGGGEPTSSEPLKRNLLTELRRLSDKLKRAIDYMSEKRSSRVTEYLSGLAEDNVDEMAATVERTPAMILQCVNVLENWITKMERLRASMFEFRERETLDSEYTFWKTGETAVRSIMDELESDDTKLFLGVVQRTAGTTAAIESIWDEFNGAKTRFRRSCGLAKDNTKYMSLIMEHYQDFVSADFDTIMKIIPIWFDDLRTVWVLSPYFGQDVNMLRLLSQISNGLCESVGRNLGDLKLIFKTKSVEEISEMSFNATKMLDVWSSGYLETRKSIERSKFKRWEFDKRALFNRIEYIKRIARDIHEIVATINQFLNILGPELRSVIKDMIGLDVMISRVKSLYKVFDAIDFDLFCEDNVENWNLFLKEFHTEVSRVEEECKLFVDWCFDNLRSCKEAYTILEKLRQFTSRSVFKEQLKTKYEAILRQYENELTTVETSFLTRRNDPPVSRHHPPVAGSIYWVRMLYEKIREPITVFQSADEFDTPLRHKVVDMYKSIVDRMKRYERSKIARWTNEAKLLAVRQMDSNVLVVAGADGATIEIGDLKDWLRRTGGPDEMPPDRRLTFKTNFDGRVYELIDEAETMENLGIVLPAEVRTLLAKKNGLLDDIMNVNNLVDAYDSFVSRMDDVELAIMKHKLKDIEDYLYAGLCRYNWLSVSIGSFADDGVTLINKTRNQLDNVKTVESHVRRSIASFESANLFPSNILMDDDDSTLAKRETSIRQRDGFDAFRDIITEYRTITERLIHLESYLFGSRTGASEPMSGLYSAYGRAVEKSVTKMYSTNLVSYNNALLGDRALINLTVNVTNGEVTVVPNLYAVHNNVIGNVARCLAWSTALAVWRHGSCVVRDDNRPTADDGPLSNRKRRGQTLYDGVTGDGAIRAKIETTRANTRGLMVKVNKYLKRWRRFRFLWDDGSRMKRDRLFQMAGASVEEYENVFGDFKRLLSFFSDMPPEKKIHCVKLDLRPIIGQMKLHARQLISSYADLLITSTREMTRRQGAVFDTFKILMDDEIRTSDDFHKQLCKIEEIRAAQTDVEIFFENLNHRVYVLEEAGVPMPRDDSAYVSYIRDDWEMLRQIAADKQSFLAKAKAVWSRTVKLNVRAFADDVTVFLDNYRRCGSRRVKDDLDVGLAVMNEYSDAFDGLMRRKETLADEEELFNLKLLTADGFDECYAEFQHMKLVYALYDKQKADAEQWSTIPWPDIRIEFVREIFGALALQFKRLPVSARDTHPARLLASHLKELRLSVPILVQLRNDSLKPRHWKEMLRAVGVQYNDGDVLLFGTVLKMRPVKHKHVIETVLNKAIDENNVERILNEINERWTTTSLDVGKHSNARTSRVEHKLRGVRSVLQMLEDDQITMHKMMNSYSVEPFLSTVETWQKNLSVVNEVLNKWWFVQQKWTCLAEIHAGKELAHVLPANAERFDELNDVYREVMADANRNSKILVQCLHPTIMNRLSWLERRLDVSQKELSSYVAEKRDGFPRFYFVSDDDLLFVYGNADPCAVQQRVIQIFDNVTSLNHETRQRRHAITSMTTCDGETLTFKSPVAVKHAVDKWLLKVVDQMRTSNRFSIKKAILDSGTNVPGDGRVWTDGFPVSVCLIADHVWWTAEVEHVFDEMGAGDNASMKRYLDELNGRIDETVGRIKNEKMPENARKKYSSILIARVHHRDVVESFIVHNVTAAKTFEWDSTLKSYWMKSEDDLYVAQCSAYFNHGYEYMGSNRNVAVVTPLTNRIFLTFTRALMAGLGGAIRGAAGTGKTETTVAMAKVLGKLCKIVHCSDGLDHRTFGRYLRGISQSEIWGLFAKFNRLSRKTLSVMSALLYSVKWTLNASGTNSRQRVVNPRVGVFVTTNVDETTGNGPVIDDIVKNHFRPAACVAPDFEQICFAVLFAEGFLEAKVLARKTSLLYKLCRDGLSSPINHAFDLRSFKLIVKTARDLMTERPELEENAIIMTVLRDANVPKLAGDDVPLFLSFVADLFPNARYVAGPGDGELAAAVAHALRRERLVNIDGQTSKVAETMATLAHRNSVAVVGPTSGGKSVIVRVLVAAFNRLRTPTKLVTINPKAYTKRELYGRADPATGAWDDGLLTTVLRDVNQPVVPNDQTSYVIALDGDVDAVWADDLNPAMDDRETLTLSNGEEIRIRPRCKLLFETGHLTYAAPSTVSRMGVVYVDPAELGYEPFWTRWLDQRSLIERTALDQCFQKYVPALLSLIFETGAGRERPLTTAVPRTKLNMVTQLCFILDTILPLVSSVTATAAAAAADSSAPVEPDNDLAIPLNSMITFLAGLGVLEAVFIQALYLSLGALLTHATGRQAFDDTVKALSGFATDRGAAAAAAGRSDRRHLKYIPSDEPTWYDHYLDFDKLEWVSWKRAVPEYVHDDTVAFNDVLVPTVESTRLIWLLKMINEYYFRSAIFKKVKRPTIVVGDTGTGKTAAMKHFVRNLRSDQYMKMALNFSAGTTSADVQRIIETNLERHSRRTYGPPVGKRLVYFVDDLNAPRRTDERGTRQPIALLRSVFDKQGVYDRRNRFDWKDLVNICFYAAMNHATGGRDELDPRFLSLCTVFAVPRPTDDTIRDVFRSILAGHTASFGDGVRSAARGLIDMTVHLYKLVLKQLHQTPAKFMYVFNLCHVSSVVNGLTRVLPSTFATTKSFVRVWRNEFTRTICDRLTCRQDRELIERHLAQQVRSRFPAESEYALRDPLLFGDCRNAVNANDRTRLYEDLIDYDSVFHLFQEILLKHDKRHGPSDVILFNDALDHIIRIHRSLRMDRGHVLLIGSSGNGKKSLSRLAAFTSGYETRVSSSFRRDRDSKADGQTFKDDLKSIFSEAGVENRPVVFIVDKVNAVDEDVLECVNNVLINGFVPSLYSDQGENLEIVRRFKAVRKITPDDVTADVCWEMFLENCLNNLHVVLLMSADHRLRTIFRDYPGFVNRTYVDWIHEWPAEALTAVAEKVVVNGQVVPDGYATNVIEQCVYAHRSADSYARSFYDRTARTICFTFKHLVDCARAYKRLVDEKSGQSSAKARRIRNGLEKIDESRLELRNITETLVRQRESIIRNDETCRDLSREIDGTRALVEEITSMVNDGAAKLRAKSEQIRSAKERTKELMDRTVPVLSTVRTLAGDIRPEQLTEMKSLDTPPESAVTLLECVAVLKGLKDVTGWKSVCEMIEDATFVGSLAELDLNKIHQRQQTQVRAKLKLLKKTADVQAISPAECSVLNFVESALKYCSMYNETIPLKNRIEKDEIHYLDATLKLEEHKGSLTNTRRALSKLEKSLADVTRANIELTNENDSLRTKFEYADKLIEGLGPVHEKWSAELEHGDTSKNQIFGNCLLSSSFLIYAGPFSLEYRKRMVFDDWYDNIVRLGIPIDRNYKLENELIDEKTIHDWVSNGVPCDEHSIQNGVLMSGLGRFPLCIDPHDRAFRWIANHEKGNSLKVLSFADPDYVGHLTNAVEYGKPVAFTDFENADTDLNDLLNGPNSSGRIELGGRQRDYHEKFRLYLTTKQTNPKIATSVYSRATVIDCSITRDGLEDELLGLVVDRELKGLNDEKKRTSEDIYGYTETLEAHKRSFLREIVGCAGPLIDNPLLSDKLDDVKSKIDWCAARLESSAGSMSVIDRSRDVYKRVAKRGASFYAALFAMKAIDPLYQFSYDSFAKLFADSIDSAAAAAARGGDDTTPTRIANIIDRLTDDVLEFSCVGIYEKHVALYLFQIACALEKNAGNLTDAELTFFVKGTRKSGPERSADNPAGWLPDKSWQEVVRLSANVERFSHLIEHVRNNVERWEKWYYSACPESVDAIPVPVIKRFDVLMLIKCFRADRVYRAVDDFIYRITGVNNESRIVKKNINFESIHEKFSKLAPCVLVLNNGSDPAKELIKLAEKNDITGPAFKALSLGICEEHAIHSALHSALDRGDWLIVRNCNYSVPFLYKTDYLLDRAYENRHPNFRLWLVLDGGSLPSASLPVPLLLRSVKVIVEPPNHMKACMQNALETCDPTDLDAGNPPHARFESLLYASLFLHGVLTERKKYGETGWRLPYNFEPSDFAACGRIIADCLRQRSATGDVPWTGLKYAIGELVYGGKVIDRHDRRIVSTYVDEYFGDFVYSVHQPFSFFHGRAPREYTEAETRLLADDGGGNRRRRLVYLKRTVNEIPLSVSPAVCGLNPDAWSGHHDGLTNGLLWDGVAKLYPGVDDDDDDGDNDDDESPGWRDDVVKTVAERVLTSLPERFDVRKVRAFYGDKCGSPNVVVLLRELDTFNALLETVRGSLSTLAEVFVGNVEMNPALEDVAACLYAGRVPDRWSNLSPRSAKSLAPYVEHLSKRALQYSNWSQIREPLVMWLSGLHAPRSYLTSLIQLACRKYGWPIERSTFYTSVTQWTCESEVHREPDTGCYVTGLYLKGARWDLDERRLAERVSRNALEQLPIMAIVPVETRMLKLPKNSITVPVYVTSKRGTAADDDNCVFEANFNTTVDRSFWILRGVCVVMNCSSE